jgi:hypothetical protein
LPPGTAFSRLAEFQPPASTLPEPLVPAGDLARANPYIFSGSAVVREQSLTCLAAAAWYEAGSDPEGQRAVIQVVLNRLKHPTFPKTICGVVLQGSERPTGCQFTFTCDGSLARRRPTSSAWALARMRAEAALNGAVDANVMQATHYHADYVAPWWSGQLERLAQVGRHIFYRWPGTEGRLSGRPSKISASESLTSISLVPSSRADGTALSVAEVPGHSLITNSRPRRTSVAPADLGIANASPGTAPSLDQSIVIGLDNSKPSGHWAIEALARCSSKPACQIIGYADAESVSRNAALPALSRDRPVFILIRDKFSGMQLALWDCKKNARPTVSQCLPDDIDQMKELLGGNLWN